MGAASGSSSITMVSPRRGGHAFATCLSLLVLIAATAVTVAIAGVSNTIDDWTKVSTLSKGSTVADVRARYDASTFQSFDPWLGLSTTPVSYQTVLVPSADVAKVKSDPGAWAERLVVETMTLSGEASFGPRAFSLWSIEDRDRQICHGGLERRLLSETGSEMVYESKFSNCPQKEFPLGPDRIVLTREFIANKSISAGTSILIASYEVRGGEMTEAQRERGLKVISDPRLVSVVSFEANGAHGGEQAGMP